MTFQIERLKFEELIAFLRFQAEDSFPDLKNENRLIKLAEKWSEYAECCTCRNEEGMLAGMIAFYANGQGADFAYIPHVYVSPDYRRKGVFSKMFNVFENYVRTMGFAEIRLEVDNSNSRAQSSYLKNGFLYAEHTTQDSVYMLKRVQK